MSGAKLKCSQNYNVIKLFGCTNSKIDVTGYFGPNEVLEYNNGKSFPAKNNTIILDNKENLDGHYFKGPGITKTNRYR